MTALHGSLYPAVSFASPVRQPSNVPHSDDRSGPAILKMGPLTPPRSAKFSDVVLTMQSVWTFQISPTHRCSFSVTRFLQGKRDSLGCAPESLGL